MYSLNTKLARQADEYSGWITEIGKYIGTFTRAEHIVSPKGTTGIDFAFETAHKQSANFALWTMGADGKEIYGFQQLQALMVCLRVKQLTPVSALATKWDSVAKSRIDMPAEVFKELMNKPIGVLFETEEYVKNDGSIGIKVVPAVFFDPQSELMASEILDQAVQPQKLENKVATLRHRPLKKASSVPKTAPAHKAAHVIPPADYDDDLPF